MTHSDEDLRAMFEALRGSLDSKMSATFEDLPNSDGYILHFRDESAGPDRPGNSFVPPQPDNHPKRCWIHIARETTDALEILCAAAHEVGHYDSFVRGSRPGDYFEYVDRVYDEPAAAKLTVEQRQSIWAEETLAWNLARGRLEPLGFADWEGFERIRERCLATYENLK